MASVNATVVMTYHVRYFRPQVKRLTHQLLVDIFKVFSVCFPSYHTKSLLNRLYT